LASDEYRLGVPDEGTRSLFEIQTVNTPDEPNEHFTTFRVSKASPARLFALWLHGEGLL
jgi:hypothetical protein